ncbi:hypothetical protein scyTo_0022652 [Scyliorhinus torazame]|uniref:Uncharacterized protein n=1 Tax=Scyliorhinus torazame TaxID=75743 RepID=A0A401QAD1_SCYTO|nr:hypothetical protein [Scyliorhinus torazame]
MPLTGEAEHRNYVLMEEESDGGRETSQLKELDAPPSALNPNLRSDSTQKPQNGEGRGSDQERSRVGDTAQSSTHGF